MNRQELKDAMWEELVCYNDIGSGRYHSNYIDVNIVKQFLGLNYHVFKSGWARIDSFIKTGYQLNIDDHFYGDFNPQKRRKGMSLHVFIVLLFGYVGNNAHVRGEDTMQNVQWLQRLLVSILTKAIKNESECVIEDDNSESTNPSCNNGNTEIGDEEGDKRRPAAEIGHHESENNMHVIDIGHQKSQKSTTAVENGHQESEKSRPVVEIEHHEIENNMRTIDIGHQESQKSSPAVESGHQKSEKCRPAVDIGHEESEKGSSTNSTKHKISGLSSISKRYRCKYCRASFRRHLCGFPVFKRHLKRHEKKYLKFRYKRSLDQMNHTTSGIEIKEESLSVSSYDEVSHNTMASTACDKSSSSNQPSLSSQLSDDVPKSTNDSIEAHDYAVDRVDNTTKPKQEQTNFVWPCSASESEIETMIEKAASYNEVVGQSTLPSVINRQNNIDGTDLNNLYSANYQVSQINSNSSTNQGVLNTTAYLAQSKDSSNGTQDPQDVLLNNQNIRPSFGTSNWIPGPCLAQGLDQEFPPAEQGIQYVYPQTTSNTNVARQQSPTFQLNSQSATNNQLVHSLAGGSRQQVSSSQANSNLTQSVELRRYLPPATNLGSLSLVNNPTQVNPNFAPSVVSNPLPLHQQSTYYGSQSSVNDHMNHVNKYLAASNLVKPLNTMSNHDLQRMPNFTPSVESRSHEQSTSAHSIANRQAMPNFTQTMESRIHEQSTSAHSIANGQAMPNFTQTMESRIHEQSTSAHSIANGQAMPNFTQTMESRIHEQSTSAPSIMNRQAMPNFTQSMESRIHEQSTNAHGIMNRQAMSNFIPSVESRIHEQSTSAHSVANGQAMPNFTPSMESRIHEQSTSAHSIANGQAMPNLTQSMGNKFLHLQSTNLGCDRIADVEVTPNQVTQLEGPRIHQQSNRLSSANTLNDQVHNIESVSSSLAGISNLVRAIDIPVSQDVQSNYNEQKLSSVDMLDNVPSGDALPTSRCNPIMSPGEHYNAKSDLFTQNTHSDSSRSEMTKDDNGEAQNQQISSQQQCDGDDSSLQFALSTDKPFECSICKKRFSHRNNLRDHKRESHLGQTKAGVPCRLCNKMVLKLYLKVHMEKCCKEQSLKCTVCGREFTHIGLLQNHLERHTKNACQYCGKECVGIKSCTKHEEKCFKVHSEVVTCSVCDKVVLKKLLTGHLEQCRKEQPLTCTVCNKKFKKHKTLKKHLQHHTINACQYCGKEFDKLLLSKHEKKCLEKNIQCLICGEKFAKEKRLESHIKYKRCSIEPRTCSICGKKYVSPIGLETHMNMCHRDLPKLHECTYCKMKCRTQEILDIHIKHSHETERLCPICGENVASASQLRSHVNKHNSQAKRDKLVANLRCEICGKMCKEKNSLDVHMRVHTGERPFKCHECGMGFVNSSNLKQHLYKHSGEKPFQCAVCKKNFRSGKSLKAHMIESFHIQD
ncbi:uncharacterized protein [Amphiura filiformis]|uniref:uncharacterized protein n=1 Tax=Amphiura filiformis TaxID=82378 RepID=UPI003B20D12F